MGSDEKLKALTVYIPAAMIAALREAARLEGRSLSSYVARLIERQVSREGK